MASFLENVFGSRPSVPAYEAVSAEQEQLNAIQGNLAALPGASDLASRVNTFNQAELDRLYEMALPGYDSIRDSLGANYASLARGEIPQDVQDAIGRSGAARALGGGYGGTGMGRNLIARDLGLTSLDLMGYATNATQRWLSTAAAPRFDVSSMFFSPAQRLGHAVNERNFKFQRDWLNAQIEAAPDPVTVGLWNTGWSVVNSVLSAYTGTATNFGMVNPQGNFGTGGGGNYMGSNPMGSSGGGGGGFGGLFGGNESAPSGYYMNDHGFALPVSTLPDHAAGL